MPKRLVGRKKKTHTPLDEITESAIEKFEVKNNLGKRARRPKEGSLAMDEVSKAKNFLDIHIQHEHFQL